MPPNIVEGRARHSEDDSLRFLDTAYGSAKELEYHCSSANRLDFFDEGHHEKLESLVLEMVRLLNGFSSRPYATMLIEKK